MAKPETNTNTNTNTEARAGTPDLGLSLAASASPSPLAGRHGDVATLFGEHYPLIAQHMTLSDARKWSIWDPPASVPAHVSSLYRLLQILSKKGMVSCRLPASFARWLRPLSAAPLERVDHRAFAKLTNAAAHLFRDYQSSCMGSTDRGRYGESVGEFLKRNDAAIGGVLSTLYGLSVDVSARG